MTLTAGTLSVVSGSVTSSSVALSWTTATSGTSPYTYKVYASTVTGFSPGPSTLVSGATPLSTLSYTVTNLIPGTQYYFVVVVTDAAAATANYSQQAAVTLAPTLSQNQFALQPYLGMVDQAYNYDTISGVVSQSQGAALSAGQAVKIENSIGGAPKFLACSANTDPWVGFINYDIKSALYPAGSPVQISTDGNVIYLYSSASQAGVIARGSQVCLDLTTVGGVQEVTGSSGYRIVGWAFDASAAPGTLIRVKLQSGFSVDG